MMDSERAKDRIEDGAAAVFEAAVAAIPIFGGPVAVIVNRTFGSAVQRRNEKIMAKFEADIATLKAAQNLPDWEATLESEEFMAALHLTFAAAQATSSEEKRKLLRSALINGYVAGSPEDRDRMLRLVVDLDPEDILILDRMEKLMSGRTEMLDHAAHVIQASAPSQGIAVGHVSQRLRKLVSEGLVSESIDSKVEEVPGHRKPYQLEIPKRQVVRATAYHNISLAGRALLEFVSDPLTDASAAT